MPVSTESDRLPTVTSPPTDMSNLTLEQVLDNVSKQTPPSPNTEVQDYMQHLQKAESEF